MCHLSMKKGIKFSSFLTGALALSLLACSANIKTKEKQGNINSSSLREASMIIEPMTYEEIASACASGSADNIVITMNVPELLNNDCVREHLYLLEDEDTAMVGKDVPYHDDFHINLFDNLDAYSRGAIKAFFNDDSGVLKFELLSLYQYKFISGIENYWFSEYRDNDQTYTIEMAPNGVYITDENGYLYFNGSTLEGREVEKTEFLFYRVNDDFINTYTWSGFLFNYDSSYGEEELVDRYHRVTESGKVFMKNYAVPEAYEGGSGRPSGNVKTEWDTFLSNYPDYLSVTNNNILCQDITYEDLSVDYEKMVIEVNGNYSDSLYYLIETGSATGGEYSPLYKTAEGYYLLDNPNASFLGETISFKYGCSTDRDMLSSNSTMLTFLNKQYTDPIQEIDMVYESIHSESKGDFNYLFANEFKISSNYLSDSYEFALLDADMFVDESYYLVEYVEPYYLNYSYSLSFSTYLDANYREKDIQAEHSYVLVSRLKGSEDYAPSAPVYYSLITTPDETSSVFQEAYIQNTSLYQTYLSSERFSSIQWYDEKEEVKDFSISIENIIQEYEQNQDVDGLKQYLTSKSLDHRYYIYFSYVLIKLERNYHDDPTLPNLDHLENYYIYANEFLSQYENSDFSSKEEVDAQVDAYIALCNEISEGVEEVKRGKERLAEMTNDFITRYIAENDPILNDVFAALSQYIAKMDELGNAFKGVELRNAIQSLIIEYQQVLMRLFANSGVSHG